MLTNMRLLAFFSLVVFAAASSPQDKPRPENAPKFSVGDRWVYQETDLANKKEPFIYSNEVSEANDEIAWLYGKSGNSAFWWKYDVKRAFFLERRKFDIGVVSKRGDVIVSNEKNDGRIQFPLEIGRSYPVREYWTNSQGEKGDMDLKVKVESYEKVRTAAGEFDAYRISFGGWWNNQSNRGSGKVEAMQWYAPAAKRIVKYKQKIYYQSNILENNTGELVEFEVSQ